MSQVHHLQLLLVATDMTEGLLPSRWRILEPHGCSRIPSPQEQLCRNSPVPCAATHADASLKCGSAWRTRVSRRFEGDSYKQYVSIVRRQLLRRTFENSRAARTSGDDGRGSRRRSRRRRAPHAQPGVTRTDHGLAARPCRVSKTGSRPIPATACTSLPSVPALAAFASVSLAAASNLLACIARSGETLD